MHKNKRKLIVFLLVSCYCLGSLFVPIYAESDMALSELLAHRNEEGSKAEETQTTPAAKKIEISDFEDIKENDWFYPYLDYLVARGMINGKSENSFEPQSSFSYAECSAVIVRYLGLEREAKGRMSEIAARLPEYKNQWYLGYFEVLANLGLFENYELFELEDGLIASVDKQAANSPIVRYRFAESISKSFETNGSILAKNVYSEIGGRGREFIVGGAYNEEILDLYQEKISDFDTIPEESARDVLKAYYNGIFNGDVSGNFYPHNNLTRAEMAKVLATIIDYSNRTRLIEDGYGRVLGDADKHTDSFGAETARYDIWTEILEKETENITVTDGKAEYTPGVNAPSGYAVDAYFYTCDGGQYKLSGLSTLHENGGNSVSVSGEDIRVLLVLRNVCQAARVEGVLDVRISEGQIKSALPNIVELL